jgi:hypothetical protein
MKTTTEEKQIANDYIRKMLDTKRGEREIYGMVTSVAKSGMSRRIKFFVSCNDTITDITYDVSKLLELNYNQNGVLRSGCGTDLVFDTIYSISKALYGDGYLIKNRSL